MSGELVIRPSFNDHVVVADLLAPGGTSIMVGRQLPIISRVVVDASVVERRPQFAEAAEGAGVPFLVDPLTPLLQGPIRKDDPWATLPFGRAEEVSAGDLEEKRLGEAFVASVVEFELDHGATAVIPPYPHVNDPDDPWFGISIEWIRMTRRYLDANSIRLPLVPVLSGQVMKFGAEKVWGNGLDKFSAIAEDAGAQSVAVCLSPVGDGKESYNKVLRLFRVMTRVKQRSSLPVIAWRQGVYGPALVASGLDGYETGIGTNEQSNVMRNISSRRPRKPGQKPGYGVAGIYLEPLGRSLNPRVAKILMANMTMRAKLMCSDERCCPQGVASTIDRSKEHAVRSRARELAELAALPARSWRLNHVAGKAQVAQTLARQANRLLAEVEEPTRIHMKGMDSLSRVCEELRRADSEERVVA